MRPIMPRMTSVGPAGIGLREARFVRPQDLFFVEGAAGIGDLPREGPDVPGPAAAVRTVPVGEGDDLEALLQEGAQALLREDGRLVGRRVAPEIHAHEQGAVVGQDPPHLVQRHAGIGHVIESVPADHEVGGRSEEHTSELQSQSNLVCRLLLEKKKKKKNYEKLKKKKKKKKKIKK